MTSRNPLNTLICRALIVAVLASFSASARVLDDFNDNVKTGWSDFTFNPALGPSQETSGQLRFELPPVQAIFIASQKTSEEFELKEGRTVEFRVDVAQTGGKDSFAVLAFIPNTGGNSPGSLAGYGLSKSTTDILITKGINKYFVADSWPSGLPNDNITLVLTMTGKDGNMVITGKVLDKANNNAVVWEKTVVDTPAAEVFAAGSDSPAAPFLTTGYFTLYLYEDYSASAPENPYLVYYDNAEVYVQDTSVLDNFDDNVKTSWSDFTFNPALGPSLETNQQLHFELPPVQAIFIASQKISRTFELKEGERVEFRVDVAQTGGKDSFAVLAFIPNTGGNSPGSLAGYGLSKSTTDILITKGINKYFVADSWPSGLPNDNITLVLTMTGKDGNMVITGKVLDKANNNAVVWEKTVVDTPAAEVFAAGSDSPAAPFLTTGYFTLYLYEDYSASAPENPYLVYYDNAEVYVQDTSVLDNFDDNVKTSWSDFTFNPALGPSLETNQQLHFELPPVQAIFIASQKISRTFELKEGERVEFRVDVAQTGGKDSFAVLAFIPNTGGNSPGSLAGYGLSKSTTDILITKGINKYFVADSWPSGLPNDNITLVLTMTGKDGNMVITGKVLDKSSNNAVVWEKTVVDTPAADVFAAGSDSPAAPFFTTGYFTLYLYEDYSASAPENPYLVYYDNATVSSPPLAANTAPIISDIQPAEFANFVSATSQISFKVTDDKALVDDRISITLNGKKFTTANGLTVTGAGGTKTVTLGGLSANVNYTAVLA